MGFKSIKESFTCTMVVKDVYRNVQKSQLVKFRSLIRKNAQKSIKGRLLKRILVRIDMGVYANLIYQGLGA